MNIDDYKTEFEEHRKEIRLEDGNRALPSRSEVHRKRKPKKKSNHTLINLFLALFTLIPIGIFIYVVSDFYKPDKDDIVEMDDTNVSIETQGNPIKPTDSTVGVVDDNKDNGDSEKAKSDEEKAEPVEQQPESKPIDVTPAPEKTPPPTPVEKKPEEKETKPVEEQKPATRTHKVSANETLYRISLKYYGSDAGVEKIKQANGLRSNDIQVGQTLIIP